MADARAEQLLVAGNPAQAASVYWQEALQNPSPVREDLQMRAIDLVLTPETRDLAREYLAQLDETRMKDEPLVEKRILEARLALLYGKSRSALNALPPGLENQAPRLLQEIQSVRADAWLQAGDIWESAATRIRLSKQDLGSEQQRANQEALWNTLNQATREQLAAWSTATGDPLFRGWLDLAGVARTPYRSGPELREALEAWGLQYPAHPARPEFAQRVWLDWEKLQFRPGVVAIMLPLTGRYGNAGNAVLVGIMSAYYRETDLASAPTLRIYDLGDTRNSVAAAYERAVGDGADAVIGPLTKSRIAQLTDLGDLPIPTLGLNTLAGDAAGPSHLIQFGLNPEDEAAETADRMVRDGHRYAIGFAPANDWGQRVVSAFDTQAESQEARLLASSLLDPEASDYSESIKQGLLIDQSERRLGALKNLLRTSIEFEPRRRQDVDAIFVAVPPRQARQLRPQLAFFYAGDLPVYGTSLLFSGTVDRQADQDLDGVSFCDMPWIISPDSGYGDQRTRLESLYPALSRDYPRLVALGMDAYNVLFEIKKLSAWPHERFRGVTGTLRVDGQGRLRRELEWARFTDGVPRMQQPAAAPHETQ